VPVLMIVHFPILIAVVLVFSLASFVSEAGVGRERTRSPRRRTSVMRTVLPARVMLGVPVIRARRETLFPESYSIVR
jgi:hypothetical protein